MSFKNLLILFALGLTLSSCGSHKNEPNTLRANLGTEPPTLDWNLANDYSSFDIISNLMVGLTRFGVDKDGKITTEPGCAYKWQISPDAKEYIFWLDPQAKWSDGRAVMAQDFIDSFARALDPDTAAPYAELLSLIDLEKTKTIDDKTLKIFLKRPAAYFIYLTSYGLTLPIRQDLINKYGNQWTEPENLVVNGPFTLKEWRHEYRIVLERNPLFHLNKAEVQWLKFFMVAEQASAFTLFKNGEFDYIDSRSLPLSEIKRIRQSIDPKQVSRARLLRNTYVGFNAQKKPFSDKRIRQAFSYAIDRNILVKIRSRDDLANSTWIPPVLSGLPTVNAYMPELARQKLAEAGYPDGKNFPEVEMLIPSREDAKLLAETLQSIWHKELNVKVKIKAMEWKVFLSTLRDDPPDIFRLNWSADYPDPDTFMQLFSTNNQANYGKWSNSQYDQLVQDAASTIDTSLRKKLYSRAEFLLTQEEMAIAPLFIDTQIIIKQKRVKNLEANSLDIVFLDKVQLSGNP